MTQSLTYDFLKSQNVNGYHVKSNGKLIGFVKKEERWTVRGTRIEWTATRKGVYVGNYSTRQEAAEAVIRSFKDKI